MTALFINKKTGANISDVLTKLERRVVNKSTYQAINKTISVMRTQAKRLINKDTGIAVGKVNKKLIEKKANRNALRGKLDASEGRAANLADTMTKAQIKAGMRQGKTRNKSGKYAKQKVKSKAWGVNKEYKGAFIAKGKNSGKTMAFTRTGADRGSKLKALRGPSIRRSFSSTPIRIKLLATASKQFGIEYSRAYNNQLRRLANSR